MKTAYLLGYQPIDILSKEYRPVDLINWALSDDAILNRFPSLADAVIDLIKTMPYEKEDFLIVNSYRNREFLPFCPVQHTVLYDPPYLGNAKETGKLFRDMSAVLGTPSQSAAYIGTANSLRSLVASSHSLAPSVYFNALTLLTDLNHSEIQAVQEYLLTAPKSTYTEYKHRAIFYGDPIDPTFFDNIASKGVQVTSYLPYEYFLEPVRDVVKSYAENLLFNPIMHVAIELHKLIHQKQVTMLILNPGAFYLTPFETRYLVEQFNKILPVYVLPGVYKGADIVVE